MPTVHVEVVQKPESSVHPDSLQQPVLSLLKGHYSNGVTLPFKLESAWLNNVDPAIAANVSSISAESLGNQGTLHLSLSAIKFVFHIYQLYDCDSVEETLDQPSGGGGLFGAGGNEAMGDGVTAALHWTLPTKEFSGIWESLYYDEPVKEKLLKYAETSLIFSDRQVDPTVITVNRVVLLHGPPGTGKTSLCKALAQKLAIRLSKRFRCGQLIEINSHSLFSKFFSESGKLVLQMFKKIGEFVEDPDVFVCVLIDEVESLTAARRGAMQGNEPSDALRVVNALLTQIDHLKRKSNVLLMATSNLIDAIDAAFIDRADMKLHVKLPSVRATYHVLLSTIQELIRVGLLSGSIPNIDPFSFPEARLKSDSLYSSILQILDVSKRSVDGSVSCRTLRKLAFLAYSEIIQTDSINSETISVEEFLPFLSKSLDTAVKENEDVADFGNEKNGSSKSSEKPLGNEKENLMSMESSSISVN